MADATPGSLSVFVDWDDLPSVTHYLVRWRVAGPGNRLNEGVEVQSSDANVGVDDYGEWVVRVQACNSIGCGEYLAKRFEVEPAVAPPLVEIATSTPATSTPAKSATTTPETGLPPHFPFATCGLVLKEAEEIDDVVLPEAAGGGSGAFTYSLTPVPEGLSFDADSRTQRRRRRPLNRRRGRHRRHGSLRPTGRRRTRRRP